MVKKLSKKSDREIMAVEKEEQNVPEPQILTEAPKEDAPVSSEVLQKALHYVSAKYNLTPDYILTDFKIGKGIIIGVRNEEVELSVKIVDGDIINALIYGGDN